MYDFIIIKITLYIKHNVLKYIIVSTSDVNLGDFLLSRDNQILKYTVSR